MHVPSCARMAAAAAARGCGPCSELHVSPCVSPDSAGSADGDGSAGAPFRSVHAAADALAACARPPTCPPATVLLRHGVHTLAGMPLRLVAGSGPQRWVGVPGPHGEPSVLSGGVAVTGWKPAAAPMAGELTHWTAPLPQGAQPKTMRIGAARAPQVTFPSVDNTPAARRYLFAREVNVTVPGTTDAVWFDETALPTGWEGWTNLVAYHWPGNSWVGMRVQATPSPTGTGPPDGLAGFVFENAAGNSNLRMGNRVQLAGAPELLGQPGTSGIWAADQHAQVVHLLSENEPEEVWLPRQSRLVTIESQSDVTMHGVTYSDTDFAASGLQNGFDAMPSDPGIPHDAAVAVSNSQRVSLSNCSFLALGGCGVVVGNRSTDVAVTGSTFTQMGQSGVLFVGNDSSQARECTISGNSMRGIGAILASAGGVVVSSASNISIVGNQISDCARWGIAVRSNGGAGSWNNTIGPGNRVERTGLTTSDFGAISFIDHTESHIVSGNRIIGNCVRDTRGMRDTMWRGIFGQVLTAFWWAKPGYAPRSHPDDARGR